MKKPTPKPMPGKKAAMVAEAKRDAVAAARKKASSKKPTLVYAPKKDAFGASGGWEGMTNMTDAEKRKMLDFVEGK
jgi:hypothetical protein